MRSLIRGLIRAWLRLPSPAFRVATYAFLAMSAGMGVRTLADKAHSVVLFILSVCLAVVAVVLAFRAINLPTSPGK